MERILAQLRCRHIRHFVECAGLFLVIVRRIVEVIFFVCRMSYLICAAAKTPLQKTPTPNAAQKRRRKNAAQNRYLKCPSHKGTSKNSDGRF